MPERFEMDENRLEENNGEQKNRRIRREYRSPTVTRHRVPSIVATGGSAVQDSASGKRP